METYKRYLILGAVIVLCLLCFIAYWAGRSTADRDAELERVSDVKQQLDYTTTELNNATRTNNAARNTITDSIRINDETKRAITDAQLIVRDASATAEQSERVISASTAILDGAYQRAQETAAQRTSK